jgi:hydroxymethylpyrimidine/phosphomethylpyrimidine kinase
MDESTVRELGCEFRGVCAVDTVQDKSGIHSATPRSSAEVLVEVEEALADGRVKAVKTGALGLLSTVRGLFQPMRKRPDLLLVIDPVASASKQATKGVLLLENGGVAAMLQGIGSIATLVTPNLQEYEASEYSECRAVFLKGGHGEGIEIKDQLLISGEHPMDFISPRIPGAEGIHGTGCMLASAVASFLACGLPLNHACGAAHAFVHQHLLELK